MPHITEQFWQIVYNTDHPETEQKQAHFKDEKRKFNP
jgi:hypothetical protein